MVQHRQLKSRSDGLSVQGRASQLGKWFNSSVIKSGKKLNKPKTHQFSFFCDCVSFALPRFLRLHFYLLVLYMFFLVVVIIVSIYNANSKIYYLILISTFLRKRKR